MRETPEHFLQEKNVSVSQNDFRRINDFVHKIVFELSKNTGEIAFFTIPEKHIVEHAGVPNFLKKNHKKLGDEIYSILEMLEDKMSFMKFISDFPLNSGLNVLIGEENILPYLRDYSLIIKALHIDGETAYIGILG